MKPRTVDGALTKAIRNAPMFYETKGMFVASVFECDAQRNDMIDEALQCNNY